MVEMLFRCNILALVGGGANPRWPKHKVMLWDDHQNRCIGELSFRSEVRAVRLRRDRVVVVLKTRVYVYNFADLTLADHLETVDNPRGLCAVCPSPTNNVLACPGASKGSVRIELYDAKVRRTVAAHEGALARLALNASGTRLATASETGTLIRVWDTATGDLLQELRRGSEKADICCIAFNSTSTLLACASDKGTVHIFKLAGNVADAPDAGGSGAASTMSGAAAGSEANAQSLSTAALSAGGTIRGGDASGVRSNASGAAAGAPAEGEGSSSLLMRGVQRMLPKYFSSEWSFAQFRVPATLSICAFSSEPNIIMGEYSRPFMKLRRARFNVSPLPCPLQSSALMGPSTRRISKRAERLSASPSHFSMGSKNKIKDAFNVMC